MDVSSKHRRTLDQVFAHPLSMNIKWPDIVKMFESLGAKVEVVNGGREKVTLNGLEETFHIPHGRTVNSRDEMMQIRHFLERCGCGPGAG